MQHARHCDFAACKGVSRGKEQTCVNVGAPGTVKESARLHEMRAARALECVGMRTAALKRGTNWLQLYLTGSMSRSG